MSVFDYIAYYNWTFIETNFPLNFSKIKNKQTFIVTYIQIFCSQSNGNIMVIFLKVEKVWDKKKKKKLYDDWEKIHTFISSSFYKLIIISFYKMRILEQMTFFI